MELFWKTTYYSIQAEKLGYDSVWITDHFNNRNVYISLSFIANYTDRIMLGPGVTNPYLIHPVMTAQSMASLSEVAPGRVMCGIGAGDRTSLAVVGVPMKNPLNTVRETAEIIKRQLAREKNKYEGSIYKIKAGAKFNFKVDSKIPIYIGAQGPKMLRLAGKIGDGVLVNASHPDDIERAMKQIKKGSDRAGRKLKDIDIAAYTAFSVAETRKKAKKAVLPVVAYIVAGSPELVLKRHNISVEKALQIREGLSNREWGNAFGSVDSQMIEAFSICGSPEECVEEINNVLKSGVTHFVTGSPLGPDKKTAINLVGKEVFPHFID
jgi:5,10-methylenetetrahydromethanopterin reductase